MEKSCKTCIHAVITLIHECSHYDRKTGKFTHSGGFCPEELICEYWEQADEFTLSINSFDWINSAKTIIVD